MKMPIRAMKKMEDLVGGQKKLDKDKDGDLDAKDFAMLRKKRRFYEKRIRFYECYEDEERRKD